MNVDTGAAVPAPAERPPRPRWRGPLVAVGVVVLLVLWGVTAALSGASAYADLRTARAELVRAEDHLQDAELREARATLGTAVDHAAAASSRLHAWHVAPLRLLPVVGPNLRTATALSDAARDVGGAAAELLAAADEIVRGEGEAELGEVSIAYVDRLTPPVRALADALTASVSTVAEQAPERLLGPVAEARDEYLELARPLADQAAAVADVAAVLPSFLGADEPRTYLVGAAALSELRGSGGLLGSFSVLTVDAGRMRFEDFVDIDAIERTIEASDVPAPSDEFAARYRRLGGLRFWRNANFTPHFPSAAEVMLELWEADGRPPLDGVVVADAITFERLADRSGPLEVPGGPTLTEETVVPFVGLEAYEVYRDDEERKRILGGVATTAFARVFEVLEDDDVPGTVRMLADLAAGGHLRVHSADPTVQAALERVGVAGALPDVAGEVAGIYVNNVAANKVDYFARRRIDHHVELADGGAAEARLEVVFANGAPTDGYRRGILGPWVEDVGPGDNLSRVTHLCGRGCTVTDAPAGARPGGTEAGLTATDLQLGVPAGQERALGFATRTPDAWSERDGIRSVRVVHDVQPTLAGTDLTIRVAVPPGWEPREVPPGAEHTRGTVVWELPDASGRRTVTLELRRVT